MIIIANEMTPPRTLNEPITRQNPAALSGKIASGIGGRATIGESVQSGDDALSL